MDLSFDDLWVRSLPGEQEVRPGSRQVHGQSYSRVLPTPVRQPRLLAWSSEAAELLGWRQTPEMADILGGNRVLPGMKPYAACYGGHQFGHWAGQLGDGRALTLGEVVYAGQRWEVQLKGAGPTPYSRRADGRAVLRSSVREFLCSEAMFHLGIPTTRALALVGTGLPVMRDMFYDGHPGAEPGAVVTRLSPSFLRFGNYEIFASRGEHEVLKQLVDFTIGNYFPEQASPLEWFTEVCRRTAELMADWMRVGFVHGVMNTDNMSILGLTIDYGPYGWLDPYQPHFTPNTTDQNLRYCYAQQPGIAQWNLARLAEALMPLVGAVEPLEESLKHYKTVFETAYRHKMRAKLGLQSEEDHKILEELLHLLTRVEIDMTIFFRNLADVTGPRPDGEVLPESLLAAVYKPLNRRDLEDLQSWLDNYLLRVGDDPSRAERMKAVNPSLIPRNYLVQQVIDQAEDGQIQPITEMLEALRQPYKDRPADDPLVQKRPDWARNAPGCSALSCSS